MKTYKFIVFIILLMGLNMGVFAQESADTEYFEMVGEYCRFINHGEDPMDEMVNNFNEKMLSKTAKEFHPKLSKSRCKELAMLYKKEQLKQDLYEVLLLSHLREQNVTVEDLQQVMEAIRQPQYQEVLEKFQKLSNARMETLLASGMKFNKPIVAVDCPKSYMEAFRDYYEKSHVQSMMSVTFDAVARNARTDNEKMFWYNFSNYLGENGFNWILNMCYGNITEEELHLMASVASIPAVQRLQSILPNMMSDIEKAITFSLYNKYKSWVAMMVNQKT